MDLQEEREAFESTLKQIGRVDDSNFTVADDGSYEWDSIHFAWTIWQAAKAQAVPDLSELQEMIAGHQYFHGEHGHMIVDMDDVIKEISGFDSCKAQAVPEKDAIIKKLSDQLYSQEMKTSAARTLCETACELLDDYAHQDAMVILNDLEQAMKEPAND